MRGNSSAALVRRLEVITTGAVVIAIHRIQHNDIVALYPLGTPLTRDDYVDT